MVEIRSYSIDELEKLTGFNQRTISYYIQQGLLPKVGRRGRSTRYPQLFVDRLKFIQRVRELQDSGRLGSVTLPRIARVIWHLVERSDDYSDFPELDDAEIQRIIEDEDIPDERLLGESSDGEPVKVSFGKFGPYVRAGKATASIEAQEFNTIAVEEALERIRQKLAEKEKQRIKDFPEEGIQILDGPYGPYVRHQGTNAKIPKDLDPAELTAEQCKALVAEKRERLAARKASSRRERLTARVQAPVPDDAMFGHVTESSEPIMMDDGVVSDDDSRELSDLTSVKKLASATSALEQEPDRLIQEIEQHTRRGRGNTEGRAATWTRAPITENIEISVQGVDPEQAELVDSLAKRIRKLLGLD